MNGCDGPMLDGSKGSQRTVKFLLTGGSMPALEGGRRCRCWESRGRERIVRSSGVDVLNLRHSGGELDKAAGYVGGRKSWPTLARLWLRKPLVASLAHHPIHRGSRPFCS